MKMSLAAIFMRSGGNGIEISERPMKNGPAFTERFVFSERSRPAPVYYNAY